MQDRVEKQRTFEVGHSEQSRKVTTVTRVTPRPLCRETRVSNRHCEPPKRHVFEERNAARPFRAVASFYPST